jgi:hypothetical protein
MDGSFSHGGLAQKQRIFNWSGIFDEMHDFERNTRGVSGGLGAVTTSATGQCGTLAQEQPVDVGGDGLGNSVQEIQDTTAGICVTDFDDIDAFVKTIRPPRALQTLDPAAVARGAEQFQQGHCAACHGGQGWTVSRRFFLPAAATNAELKMTPFEPPNATPIFATHDAQIAPQPAAEDTTGAAIPPNQVACVLRDAGTFGLPGDAAGTDALEKKVDGSRAQGAGGYNVPSLYGLAVGAPYLHHGQARTLAELLGDSRWAAHLTAGNAAFAPSAAQRDDLAAYLLAIDAETTEVTVPDGHEACPVTFPAPLTPQALRASVPEQDAAPGRQADRTFVGALPDANALIALVANEHAAIGYVCDGAALSEWYLGAGGSDLQLVGEKGGTLSAQIDALGGSGSVTAAGAVHAFTLEPAVERESGLFRSVEDVEGETIVSTWIFLDGELRGADEDSSKSVVGSTSLSGLDDTTGSGTGTGPEPTPEPVTFSCFDLWCQHESQRCAIKALSEERAAAKSKKKLSQINAAISKAQRRLNQIGNDLIAGQCGEDFGDGFSHCIDTNYDSAQDTPCCDQSCRNEGS